MRGSCLTLGAIAIGIAFVACRNSGHAGSATGSAALADTTAPTRAAAPLRLADLAGKWTMTANNAANDSTLVKYEMTATADTAGWFIRYPTHARPIALRVNVDADSVIMDAGPYASTARKDAMVTIHGVARLHDARLVGTETARYSVKGTESVVHITLSGTRNR